jgi:hypothetical protein
VKQAIWNHLVARRWHILGAAFLGAATCCFEQHGRIEERAARVWETADKIVREAEAPKE